MEMKVFMYEAIIVYIYISMRFDHLNDKKYALTIHIP